MRVNTMQVGSRQLCKDWRLLLLLQASEPASASLPCRLPSSQTLLAGGAFCPRPATSRLATAPD